MSTEQNVPCIQIPTKPTFYYPTKKITINDFLRKENELKSLGVTVHRKDNGYLIQQEIPENVSYFELWRQGQDDSWIDEKLKDIPPRYKPQFTEALFEMSMAIYKKEFCKRGYDGIWQYATEENVNPVALEVGLCIQQKETTQYVWLYLDENKEFISSITRYHPNIPDYLIHTLEKVTRTRFIDEDYFEDDCGEVA